MKMFIIRCWQVLQVSYGRRCILDNSLQTHIQTTWSLHNWSIAAAIVTTMMMRLLMLLLVIDLPRMRLCNFFILIAAAFITIVKIFVSRFLYS